MKRKQYLVGLDRLDSASDVRSKPYTTQGCRPISAVYQPTWLAICGSNTDHTKRPSAIALSNSFFR